MNDNIKLFHENGKIRTEVANKIFCRNRLKKNA